MREQALKNWRHLVALVTLNNDALVKPHPLSLSTGLDPEVLQHLRDRNGQMISEFQSYRYGDTRKELEASVNGEGPPLHGKFIYVLSPFGKLYVHPEPAGVGGQRVDDFRHSAFLAGRPVMSAGQMFIWKGQLLLVDNASGHYKPKAQTMQFILRWLRNKGIELKAVLVSFYLGNTYNAFDFMLAGDGAIALKPELVPDVEAIFGFVERQEKSGVTYGSFEEASMAMDTERAEIKKRGAERASVARKAKEEKGKALALQEQERKQRAEQSALKRAAAREKALQERTAMKDAFKKRNEENNA